jgi:hypothetical protein
MPEVLEQFLKSLSPVAAEKVFIWLDETPNVDLEMIDKLLGANPGCYDKWPSLK